MGNAAVASIPCHMTRPQNLQRCWDCARRYDSTNRTVWQQRAIGDAKRRNDAQRTPLDPLSEARGGGETTGLANVIVRREYLDNEQQGI